MSKIAVSTISDKNYLFHFETFYKSFILNETNPNVFYEHFYIYKNKNEITNFNNKYHFLKQFPKININFVPHNISYCDSIKLYSAHYRYFALKNLLLLNKYDKLLYLDIDSYINKSIFNICNEIKQPFGVFLRMNKKNNICEKLTNTEFIKQKYKFTKNTLILSGSIFCNSNNNSKLIIDKLIKKFISVKIPRNFDNLPKNIKTKYWTTDQKELENIFIAYANKIDIYILPNLFLNLYCDKNCNIFFVKGKEASWKSDMWQNIIQKTKKTFFEKYKI